MSLPTECELVRRVQDTAIAVAAADPPSTPASPSLGNPMAASEEEGPSAMEEEGVDEGPAAAALATAATGRGRTNGAGGSGGSRGSVVAPEAAWAELLPVESNWHKTVYTLQIIDALLLPAPVSMTYCE